MLLSVLLLLLQLCGTDAGYTGAVITYTIKDLQGGSFSVIGRCRFSFSSCVELESWICSGCIKKIEESSGEWCLGEYIWTWTSAYFSWTWPGWAPGTWINNTNQISSGLAKLLVEVRTRSDINRPNLSPQTSILPVLRVPSNCQRNISLLTFDHDGDMIKCRYGADSNDCVTCTPPSVLTLSSPCTLSFSPTKNSTEGSYAVQLKMEDFPRKTITITDNGGSTWSISTSIAMSRIPVQFVFKVDPAAPSCTEGEYLPRFLPPTPGHGAQIFVNVSQMLEIPIRAEANQSMITELLFSGPLNMVKNSSGSGYFTLRWTPSTSEDKESHPVCFVVQANGSSSVYQSELRCAIVTVGSVISTPFPLTSPNPPPRTSHLMVLKLKISTRLSLKDNHDTIKKAIREELIRQGLPPDINVRLMSNGSVEVKKTAAP